MCFNWYQQKQLDGNLDHGLTAFHSLNSSTLGVNFHSCWVLGGLQGELPSQHAHVVAACQVLSEEAGECLLVFFLG